MTDTKYNNKIDGDDQNNVTTLTSDIIMIVDESESMSDIEIDVKKSVVDFIRQQPDNTLVSLWCFGTFTDLVYMNRPSQQIHDFDDYSPSGLTALWDAIGQAIDAQLKITNKRDVTCVIITDGKDTFSFDYSLERITEMIQQVQDELGWKFVFIASGQEAFEECQRTGITPLSFNSTPGSLSSVLSSI